MSPSDACADIVPCQGCVVGCQHPVLLSPSLSFAAALYKHQSMRGAAKSKRIDVQAASDVYSPISGEVVESNQGLADEPGKVGTCCLCSVVPWLRTLMPSFSCRTTQTKAQDGCCLLPVGHCIPMKEAAFCSIQKKVTAMRACSSQMLAAADELASLMPAGSTVTPSQMDGCSR